MNWIIEYNAMNLKQQNEVVKAALPYDNNIGTHEMSWIWLVNGAAIDASANDNEIPASAVFKAPQSLAPSPQNPTKFADLCFYNYKIRFAFSSGLILA